MDCKEIHANLKNILSDLLTEREYQLTWSHLDSCAHCLRHVERAGSIPSYLSRFNSLEIPSDLKETILFQYRQDALYSHRERPGLVKRKIIFIIFILIFAGWAALTLAGIYLEHTEKHRQAALEKQQTKVADEEEAKQLIGQLSKIAGTLGADIENS